MRIRLLTIVAALCLGVLLMMHLHRLPWRFHKIYIGANVLTLDEALPTAEAVVTSGSRIVFVGEQAEALRLRRWHSAIIDLHGKTLMPGFIDAHSHFLSNGLTSVLVDLNASPMGNVDSLDTLYQVVADAAASTSRGEWIVGFNYDNSRFSSASHPDRDALDAITSEHPVYLRHHSGHMGVANSMALQILLMNESAVSPQSDPPLEFTQLQAHYTPSELASVGVYSDGERLNGLLQETMAPSLMRFTQNLSLLDYWRIFQQAHDRYLQYGYTLVQEGAAGPAETHALKWLSRLSLLRPRVNVWQKAAKARDRRSSDRPLPVNQPFFLADTIKIIVDGSPQGGTAYLSQPYANSPHFHGIVLHDHRQLMQLISRYWQAGFRVAIHANGDAAIDNVIHAVDLLQQRNRLTAPEKSQHLGPRLILVHAQTIRMDQLNRLDALGISPSFFSAHSWYWGDWHRLQTLGTERAEHISPTGSASRLHLPFTIHSDAPVSSPNPWELLWITTQRLTRSGWLLGPEERISRIQGLRAMTIDAARQAGLHDQLGSISVGKLADMIVVSDHPLQIDDVRRLRVEQTIVHGKSIYHSK